MAGGPPMTEGVDYAWSRPNVTQLVAAGKRFACRYGGPGTAGKQLDPAEARALSAAGVAIVANAEGSAAGLLGGWSAGVDWASRADAHFAACGMPPDRPIYLSVDFDVTSSQWAAVANALRGAATVLGGVNRVGVYGGRRAIEWARRDGVAAWFWQTFAWSSGVWVPGNHIEQYQNGVALAGATLDLDRALQSDYGQWGNGADDMDAEQSRKLSVLDRLFVALVEDTDTINDVPTTDGKLISQPFPLARRVRDLAARPASPRAEVDVAALVAALRPELDAAAERAVRKVLGEADER